MKEIKAIIHPDRLNRVLSGLHEIPNLPGFTVSTVLGYGRAERGGIKGAILKSAITQKLETAGFKFEWIEAIDKKESPGHMQHHYMPSIPFIVCRNSEMKLSELTAVLNRRLAELPDTIEGIKIIKPKSVIKKIEFLKLSSDPAQAAREVYSQLRAASLRSPDALCFIQTPVHSGEMWESVFDRLYKAASLILD